MTSPKPALYAAGVTCLGFICLILACVTVFVPIWGNYEDRHGGYQPESGYFGPWKVCKKLHYNREFCSDTLRFRVSGGVYVSGILALISCICFAGYSILSVVQIAMIVSRDRVAMKYKSCVIFKLALATIAALLALVAAILFAVEIDGSNRGFIVTRGISFYFQILVIVLAIALAILSLYDVIFTFRVGGDPTLTAISTAPATTYNNPGFREGAVSVTDSSGKPYLGGSNGHGSIISMNTTVTSVSNGSTLDGSVTRSPLRSSLKKPRVHHEGLGIQNPGYSGASDPPRMNRSGSVKKVRIQTHSTEV